MAENIYTSNYSGKQIDDGIAAIPQLTKRIESVEKSIAGDGDTGIGNTVSELDTRISNNTNAILEIKEDLLPAKVNLSDYNSKIGSIETQVQNLNTNFGTLEGKVNLKADTATLLTTKNNLQTSVDNLEKNYKQADTQLDDRINDLNESLTGTISDLSLTVDGHTTKIAEMETKVNSAPTDANFTAMNDKIVALETDKANKTELQEINNNVAANAGNISNNASNISTNTNNIQNLSLNKVDLNVFNNLELRVTSLEEDTTTEGLTDQITELQKSINSIKADLLVINSRLDELEKANSSTT